MTELLCIFAVFILKVFLDTFFVPKKSASGIAAWVLYFCWQLMMSRRIMFVEIVNLAIVILVTILVAWKGYQGGFKKKIIFSVLFNAIAMLSETFCGYAFMILSIDYLVPRQLGSLISKILFLIVILALRRFFRSKQIRELPDRMTLLLFSVPVCSIWVVNNIFALSAQAGSKANIFSSLITSVLMIGINIAIFIIYAKLADSLEMRRRNTVYEQQLDLCEKHIAEKNQAAADFKIERHNRKQRAIELVALAEQKDYDKIKELANRILEEGQTGQAEIARTENLMIDTLVNYKYSIALQKKINVQVDLTVPSQLPYNNGDLTIILGNAIDNAIEASEQVEEKKRYIRLKIKYDMGVLKIVVKNSFDGKITTNSDGSFRSRKEDSANHGIGVYSIKKAVEKYQGVCVIATTDEEFSLKLTLYAPKTL